MSLQVIARAHRLGAKRAISVETRVSHEKPWFPRNQGFISARGRFVVLTTIPGFQFDQVIARAHRLGAKREIKVEKLVSHATVEELMERCLPVFFFLIVSIEFF